MSIIKPGRILKPVYELTRSGTGWKRVIPSRSRGLDHRGPQTPGADIMHDIKSKNYIFESFPLHHKLLSCWMSIVYYMGVCYPS